MSKFDKSQMTKYTDIALSNLVYQMIYLFDKKAKAFVKKASIILSVLLLIFSLRKTMNS